MNNSVTKRLSPGDFVQHFKRELVEDKTTLKYIYKILSYAIHTETGEKMVVYQALYDTDDGVSCPIFVRPYDMFMGEVDKHKYPNIKQRYVFERF